MHFYVFINEPLAIAIYLLSISSLMEIIGVMLTGVFFLDIYIAMYRKKGTPTESPKQQNC